MSDKIEIKKEDIRSWTAVIIGGIFIVSLLSIIGVGLFFIQFEQTDSVLTSLTYALMLSSTIGIGIGMYAERYSDGINEHLTEEGGR